MRNKLKPIPTRIDLFEIRSMDYKGLAGDHGGGKGLFAKEKIARGTVLGTYLANNAEIKGYRIDNGSVDYNGDDPSYTIDLHHDERNNMLYCYVPDKRN